MQLRALRLTQAGAIEALLTYAEYDGPALDAQLTSAAGGSARVRGNATLDLGYPAIARGIDAGNAPVEPRQVEANALDVTWMSGLISPIRRLGGRLTVSARGHGTLGALSSSPLSVSGRLEWTDGVLALVGFGGYRGIHLVAHGDQHAIFLDGLDARGREGQAHLSGALNLGRDGQQLQLTAKVNRFPIYAQGQLSGTSVDRCVVEGGDRSPSDRRLSEDRRAPCRGGRPAEKAAAAEPPGRHRAGRRRPADRPPRGGQAQAPARRSSGGAAPLAQRRRA